MRDRQFSVHEGERNSGRNYMAAVGLLLIVAVVSVPLMTDYVLISGNLLASLSRIEAVRAGIGRVFPVRIGPWASLDYGYGAASFQADVFFLVPALLRVIGFRLETAYKFSLFLINTATAVIAYRCFRKCVKRRETGLAASMLYTWCPYRVNEMYVNGNLGDAVAWAFVPIVIMGLTKLSSQDSLPAWERGKYDRLWVTFTWGFSLLAVSSTSILLVTAGMSVLVFLFMGKRSLQRRVLAVVVKTICATLLVNAWFLAPMLLRMRDPLTVGILIPRDFRSMGMYFAQYLSVFQWGGDNVGLFENGMVNAQAMGPGIAVILLVLLCVWNRYVHSYQDTREREWFAGREMCVCLVLIFLSSNSFPWDLFQNRNMLFSVLLALLQSPAKWGVAACTSLIALACVALRQLEESERDCKFALFVLTAVSFCTTQFLLGNILKTRAYVRLTEEAYELIPLQVIVQESKGWRLCEIISIVSGIGCLIMFIVRRQKGVKRV